jgi:HNH endonuclease
MHIKIDSFMPRYRVTTSCYSKSFTYVSGCDIDRVAHVRWYLRNGYPNNNDLGNLHHVVMGPRPKHVPEDWVIDHKNRDKLDNTRENLRWVSMSFNAWNVAPQANCTSKYKSVCWDKNRRKWVARVLRKCQGSFDDERAAGLAAAKAAIREFGDLAATSDLLLGPELFSEDEIEQLKTELLNEPEVLVTNRSLPKGVCWNIRRQKYIAQFRGRHLGEFDTPEAAKVVYDNAVKLARETEWKKHVALGIPRDEDGDAVIALTANGTGLFSKVPEQFYFQLTFNKSWSLCDKGKYARGTWMGRGTTLHLVVWALLNPGYTKVKGISIDHKDPEQTLNNLQCNLRKATRSEQERNKVKKAGLTSKYMGVCYTGSSWKAQMDFNGRHYCVCCATEIEAARAINRMRLEFFGSEAILLRIEDE